jgi:alpha-ketoglutarate-dependent taurine dioxygenase
MPKQTMQEQSGFNKFRDIQRKAVRLSQDELAKTDYLRPEEKFPLVIQPTVESLSLHSWAGGRRDLIEAQLLEHGAILFRGFNVRSIDEFQLFTRTISPDLLGYFERAAPRKEVGHKIFTSTEYPADQWIPLHHEMSYSHNWPTKIWFYCAQPALEGGATPIANDRKIFDLIPPEIKEPFIKKKVMYIRNYGEGVDMPWQEVFQTTERSVVEEYCQKVNTEFEWRDGNRLRTRQVRQAVATHPRTGETVWFNHAHLFHCSNLQPAVREALLSEFKEDELPRNAFYGDGTSIETSVLDTIREIYQREAITFTWQMSDILMVDNFLVSHGREPYVGPRKILVAMSELYTAPTV